MFNELFAGLGSNRDRALVAFWVSTGARASELLGVTRSGADPGQQLITVTRKGSRAVQRSRRRRTRSCGCGSTSRRCTGWSRRAGRPAVVDAAAAVPAANYDAARKMFDRANDAVGAGWTLHSLRHSAAYRMARDPEMPITDVQWVLGHASLTSTQIYVVPTAEDVIEARLAHHRAVPSPARYR